MGGTFGKKKEERRKLEELVRQLEEERARHLEEERVRQVEDERVRQLEELFSRDMKLLEEEEEKLKKEMEEKERKKGELENRRKLEKQLIEQLEGLSARYMKAKQEGWDYELAFKLANERKSAQQQQQEDLSPGVKCKKYDLSKWKYSELRDKVNTSTDIEMLEACREEFHRRLKMYHAWKANNNKTLSNKSQTSQKTITDANLLPEAPSQTSGVNVTKALNNPQRYFRIPFVRPGEIFSDAKENGSTHKPAKGKKGWWYGHFDGQYVARQMELYPDKPAILLVRGIDDMQMCKLSLEETGLATKKGAEILEQEFDKEWVKNGGKLYLRLPDRVK